MTDPIERLNAALEGRYRIERELGAGGMATVYLAHDVRHKRDVAIKVLRPELAAIIGAERFLAEIETTARLQHPHILPLFDSGEADSFLFYVMPYVEGESLRDRLDRERQLPVDEAVRIAVEAADALDYAHRHGVVHRDIKPANLLLHDGRVLVADFGIALAVREAGGARMTETGLSLGTPHYMSPEQATADQDIDARSDIYSLGAVLYEMLAGRPPHAGTSLQAVIASVLTRDPVSVTEERPAVPAGLAAVVGRAIERLPADRFQSAAELAGALERHEDFAPAVGADSAGGAHPGRARWERPAWIGATVVLAVLALRGLGSSPAVPETARFRFEVPIPFVATDQSAGRVDISPDGSTLVYAAPGGSAEWPTLYTRRLDGLASSLVSGAIDFATDPRFAPDGRSVSYNTESEISIVDLDRDLVTELTDRGRGSTTSGPARWGSDGYVYFASGEGIIVRIPSQGGEPEPVTTLSEEERNRGMIHRGPAPLPGGRGVLYHALGNSASAFDVFVHDSRTGETRRLLAGASPVYLPIGVLAFQTPEGRIDGVPFDLESLDIQGSPRPLVTGVRWDSDISGPSFGVSDGGILVYEESARSGTVPVWVDREGGVIPVDEWSGLDVSDVSVAPDGRRLAITAASSAGDDIWVLDLDQGTRNRITTDGTSTRPRWLPGGEEIAFVSNRDSTRAIYATRSDGSGGSRLLVGTSRLVQEITFRGDGAFVYREGFSDGTTNRDLYLREPGDTVGRPIAASEFDELGPALSPDGRWLAYVSNEPGRDEVYVRPIAGSGARVTISANGGSEPAWSADGGTVYYRSAQDSLVAVRVETGGAGLRVRARENLFSTARFLRDRNERAWDVQPDGDRFVFVRHPETVGLVVVTDWFSEVREILGID